MRLLFLIVALVLGLNRAFAEDLEEGAVRSANEEASLGIGFDVFLQVYGFAAGRVGAPLDPRLVSCKNGHCTWAVADGVTLRTEHQQDRLDMHRIEAAIEQKKRVDPNLLHRYEQVCLTIVAIVDRQASAANQRATATAIASPADEARRFQLDGERDVRLYGEPPGRGNAALRCGAVAMHMRG